MNYSRFTIALAIVLLVVACSPAPAPTPVQLGSAPTSAVTTPTPGQLGGASTLPSASPTASPSSAGVAATSPSAVQPATSTSGSGETGLTVTSDVFSEGSAIPKKYTCDGSSVSPPVKWTGAPAQTASFVLLVVDPDAPSGTFTHWVAFDIPSNSTGIPEGVKNVGKSGKSSAGRNGFIGPCPPSGTHRYIFTVYALDIATLNLPEGASRDQVTNAIQGHILAQGTLMGRYGR